MDLNLDKIKVKKQLWDRPISVRPKEGDVSKLKKMAKKKGMRLHPFLVEVLHIIANSEK